MIANTWCWPVDDDFHFRSFSFLMSSWIGQYLIKHHNIFVNKIMPKAVGNRDVLTPEVMAHYRNPLPSPDARAANAALPGYIVGASEWLDSIWARARGLFGTSPHSSYGDAGTSRFGRRNSTAGNRSFRILRCMSSRIADTFYRKRPPKS